MFQILGPNDVPFSGFGLFVLRVAVTIVLADISFRFVESHFRLRRAHRASERKAIPRRRTVAWIAVAVVVAFALGNAMVRVRTASDDVLVDHANAASDPIAFALRHAPPSTATIARRAATTVPQAPLPRRVVVVGDSQARALLVNAPPMPELTLTNGAVEGCGLEDEGSMRTRAHFRRDFSMCAGWDQQWSDAARRARAQIALVVIGAWDVFDLSLPSGDLTFNTPASDRYLSGQLQRGIDALKAAGAKVALMEVPCYRPIDAGGLIRLPERGDDARTGHLNKLLRAAAHRDPRHVFYVHSPVQFCTDEKVARDTGARWDGVHYYKPGADLVFSVEKPALLAIPVAAQP